MKTHLHYCQYHLDMAGIAMASAQFRLTKMRDSIANKHALKLETILAELKQLQDEISESLDAIAKEVSP